ncbi:GFA family protein [Pseudoteredinibacter isoporae]|uniref:GFA family protein n=1 Tax=Pseudoteredinibacter isoporae TaxID=570281 RepID=UPI00333F0EF0
MTAISGSCLCGSVEFSVKDEFIYAGYCHCSMCRKSSGASGTAIGGIPREHFTITQGEEYVKTFCRSTETVSCFCEHCGSTLYGEKPAIGMVHVRYGALNRSPKLLPQAHMHVSSKADWYNISDSLPQFSEFPAAP